MSLVLALFDLIPLKLSIRQKATRGVSVQRMGYEPETNVHVCRQAHVHRAAGVGPDDRNVLRGRTGREWSYIFRHRQSLYIQLLVEKRHRHCFTVLLLCLLPQHGACYNIDV